MTNSVNRITCTEELAATMINEINSLVNRKYSTYGDKNEIIGYLTEKTWVLIHDNEKYQNIKGIRIAIRNRATNFFKKEKLYTSRNVNHSLMEKTDNSSSDGDLNTGEDWASWEEFKTTCSSSRVSESEDQILDRLEMTDFMSTLRNKERDILMLFAQKYQGDEVSEMLGIHRDTIYKTLKRLREKALDFGLWNPSDMNIFNQKC